MRLLKFLPLVVLLLVEAAIWAYQLSRHGSPSITLLVRSGFVGLVERGGVVLLTLSLAFVLIGQCELLCSDLLLVLLHRWQGWLNGPWGVLLGAVLGIFSPGTIYIYYPLLRDAWFYNLGRPFALGMIVAFVSTDWIRVWIRFHMLPQGLALYATICLSAGGILVLIGLLLATRLGLLG